MPKVWNLSISDDSGFMGLIDPDAYEGFVSTNWKLDQLFGHFKKQMSKHQLLLWGTGLEGFWSVEIRLNAKVAIKGFRSTKGSLNVSAGRLCLVNYETLTMAAQFEDVKLPQKHLEDCYIKIPPAVYECNIVQSFNPAYDATSEGEFPEPNFIIDLHTSDSPTAAWAKVAWWKN